MGKLISAAKPIYIAHLREMSLGTACYLTTLSLWFRETSPIPAGFRKLTRIDLLLCNKKNVIEMWKGRGVGSKPGSHRRKKWQGRAVAAGKWARVL